METTFTDCPLFTARHAHHSVVWCIPGVSLPTLCIACATERLENKGELGIHVKKVLGELQALLDSSSGKLLEILNTDRRVTEHLCGLLFNLIHSQDVSVAQSSIDLLMSLITLTRVQDMHMKLLQRTIQIMMTSHNFLSSLPLLMFLGRLLHSVPSLCTDITQSYGGFLEFLLGGMTYPDEMVKSAVVYILVQVCSKTSHGSIPLPIVQNMCRHISSNLASAKSHDLTINLLGFVRHLLKNGTYAQCLLQADQHDSQTKGSTFASAFKRVLLSQDELLQLSGVQCIAEVLMHHTDYGRVLLSADIAEFMLEALSSKNELLLQSLFSCLNSLASIDDFYSKCHVIYGVDPITTGLATALRLRNYDAAQLGFNLLGKILSRQPSGLPLFSSHQSLHKLLELITTALQVHSSPVVLHATSTLSGILSVQHVPVGFPFGAFIPLLAILLHHVEPLTSPTSDIHQQHSGTSHGQEILSVDMTPSMKKLAIVVFTVMENANRFAVYCTELTGTDIPKAPLVQPGDCTFLLQTFEESLLPVFLIHVDQFDQPKLLTSVLNISICHFSLLSKEAVRHFAKRLAFSGFIQLVLDMKGNFAINLTQRYQTLQSCCNQFLEQLCFHLEMDNNLSAFYVKDILHEALPDIKCSLSSCLQILCKSAGRHPQLQTSAKPLGAKSNGLQNLQFAVLALLYHAYSWDVTHVPSGEVFSALNGFLSLNPNVHLLPLTTLRHLTAVYALCDSKSGQTTSASDDLLVRGLKMVSDSSSLFVPHSYLLHWAFRHIELVDTVAKTWLHQWLSLLSSKDNDDQYLLVDKLTDAVKNSPTVRQSLLEILMTDTQCHSSEVEVILSLLDQLVSTGNPCYSLEIYKSLQKALLMQRVQPLSDSSVCAMLKALAKVQKHCKAHVDYDCDLKLAYQVANVVTRTQEDDAISAQVAQYGMEFLVGSLVEQSDGKIAALLLNNKSFLQKLVALVSEKDSPKSHSILSAGVLLLLAELINLQNRTSVKVSQSVPDLVLPLSSMISALLSPLIPVQIAALHFWKVVFSNGGKTGCFVLHDLTKPSDTSGLKCIRLLFFLVQNCLVKGFKSVQESAAYCFVALVNYAVSVMTESETLSTCHQWCFILLHHLTDVYHASTLPYYYVSCITTMLNSGLVPSIQLKSVAQLLYKSCVDRDESLPNDVRLEITTAFSMLQNVDGSILSHDQWSTLKKL